MRRPHLALSCLLLIACGPSLKRSEEFTPKRVREVMFNDECRLQAYFDHHHPSPKLLTQQNVSTDPKFAAGEANFVLSNEKNLDAFWRMLARLYTKIPPPKERPKKLEVDLRYHKVGERDALPIGAETLLRYGEDELSLPYHPCIGAFFYGREHYRIRSTLAPTSAGTR